MNGRILRRGILINEKDFITTIARIRRKLGRETFMEILNSTGRELKPAVSTLSVKPEMKVTIQK